jgi:IS5 family transposase
MMLQGTLMDTTIIKVPSSTQNKQNQRDSDMCQTQKGNK